MGMIDLLRRLAVLSAVVYGVTLLAVLLTSLYMTGAHDRGASWTGSVDVAVVLAAGVDPDGVPNFATRRRVIAAARLMAAGRVDKLMMSGGRVGNSDLTLAEYMERHAISLGVDPSRILLENKSRTTWENVRFSAAMLDEMGVSSVALVTDSYHLIRASLLADLLGLDAKLVGTPALKHEPFPNRLLANGREAFAWWYNIGKAGAWFAMGWAGYTEAERAEWVY